MKQLLCLLLSTFVLAIPTHSQIIFTRDTTLTGSHTFEQFVGVYDASVNVTIDGGYITFMQGMSVEYGHLSILGGSSITFRNGYGLSMSRNAELLAIENSNFSGFDSPTGISLWHTKTVIEDCIFSNITISVMEPWSGTITQNPTFVFRNSSMHSLPVDYPNPLIFSQGVNMWIYESWFSRENPPGPTGEYPNIHLQSNRYSKIEGNEIWRGGISAGSVLNSDIVIIDNIIENSNKGISFWGVSKIEYNIIRDVNIGIEGGTLSNPLNNLIIHYNNILNVSERAIDLVGDSIIINDNGISGYGNSSKGIRFDGSNSKITYNLLRDFKIDDSVYDFDGVALYINNAGPGVEVIGNVFEHCGLSSSASSDKVCSIVYLKSPITFMSNDLRLNTLGGPTSPTNSFAGGPVLDIVSPGSGIPIIKYNLIRSNNFVAAGVYEPTNTSGTLVAIDYNRMVEFKGNYLIGDPALSLGIAIFPDGAIDLLLFEENTIMDNYVGIGTMQTPVLGTHNIIKDNTDYHIMRYGYGTSPTLYALSNNWDSDDPVVIDDKFFDDEEGFNTGPIDFGNYYNTSYDVNVSYTIPPSFNPEDSLEITAEVTDPSGGPVANMPVFFSSSKFDYARFRLNGPITGNDGRVSVMLYAINGGTTYIEVFAGDKITAPIEVNVEGVTSIDEQTKNSQVEFFCLIQNYPNPFNPSTTINYSIPNHSFVTLKVFDVLGREITSLVNQEQSFGNYEIEFDASSLTSGIYFYRIQAGDFVETKKMILMK